MTIDRVAALDQAVDGGEEPDDVGRMQPRGGFVEDVQRAPGARPRQLRGELHPLRLAAGEHRRGMAERQVA